MKLVLLAAGHGTRFGGLKQVAPVGPAGEAIMDHTVRHAEQCGYEGVVLVVREEIREEIASHVRTRWSPTMPVELVCQPRRPGTAYAVLCTRPLVDGPFAVANADDLYEPDALALLRDHFAPSSRGAARPEHVLVAYELTKTVLTAGEVKRGICAVGPGGMLKGVAEHKVRLRTDGCFQATPLERALQPDAAMAAPVVLDGSVPVSMNLWGFAPSVFEALTTAVVPFEPGGPDREVLLPEVVGASVAAGRAAVQVVRTTSRCYGVTHREDVPLVREHLEVRSRDELVTTAAPRPRGR